MRCSILISLIALAVQVMAYEHGEIRSNVAVRSDGKGGIEHFYERDRIAHEEQKRQASDYPEPRRRSQKKRQDPMLDYYPVKSDGKGGVMPFVKA
ncbi:hypothetical protein BD324DRAFT_652429 [Kockovaella imperatae]|uniref:Uncharacterized protein n=1 Tax=Kockovaella imperatae TaxID=4999 RepID=A0A1Y1UCP7_9TREE|nr:hypothetical protein BD324DRAFT_652429 [Kockovaella imperatae]ORX35294.1 hypothetical protein BD324DRAFT_652429 [Kockovaella imperatae]